MNFWNSQTKCRCHCDAAIALCKCQSLPCNSHLIQRRRLWCNKQRWSSCRDLLINNYPINSGQTENVIFLCVCRVGYILNVTREIDNFYPGIFKYMNIRLYDNEQADLLRHWEQTHRFICKARDDNSKILIHCKMGVSRSASTVSHHINTLQF